MGDKVIFEVISKTDKRRYKVEFDRIETQHLISFLTDFAERRDEGSLLGALLEDSKEIVTLSWTYDRGASYNPFKLNFKDSPIDVTIHLTRRQVLDLVNDMSNVLLGKESEPHFYTQPYTEEEVVLILSYIEEEID